MAVLGPRWRRGLAHPLGAHVGARPPLLPAARRMPTTPWQARDAFLVLGAGLLFLSLALIVTLGFAQLQAIDTHATGPRAVISTLVSIGFLLFSLAMIWLLIMQRYRSTWDALGLRNVSWQWFAAVPLIFAFLIFTDVLVLRTMVSLFGPAATWPAPLTTTTLDAMQQPALEVLTILTGVVLTPIVEELLFRGVLYQALRRKHSVGNAALLSALIFALMHGSIVLFIPLTVMGIVLAFVYERSGSLIPTMLVHACNNAIILLIVAGNYPYT